jgi:predicted nucleic acid-binding protein
LTAAFVPDASVTLAWCFEDGVTAWTDSFLYRLKHGDEAVVPAHWPVEVSNALLTAMRRKRITDQKALRFVNNLNSLPIRIDPESTVRCFDNVLALGQRYGLTAYDAGYLDVAMRAGAPLATLDQSLRQAAMAAGAQVLEQR